MKKFKICICGGGSTYTLPMVKTLCDSVKKFPISELRLYDTDPKKQEMIFEAVKVMVKELLGEEVDVKSCYNEEAFYEIDFAFMQIRSGGLAMREMDEKIPLAHDCVGQETCGAGGFAYGMRSVGQVIELVKMIRQHAKEAWIINYSNPAAIVAEATKRIFPNDDRLINLCDMPIAIMDGFAESLQMKRSDFTPRYFGLNHFGWFTHLYDKHGNDLLPLIKDKLKNGAMMPKELSEDTGWIHTFNQLTTMVNDIDGYIPNTYLQYYLYPNKMVKESDKNYTRANAVMDHRLKEVERQCQFIVENNSIYGSGLEKGVHGMYIIELASSIIHNEGKTFIMMVENQGIIPNLPPEAMVEVPCIVTRNGCEPIHVGVIETFYKALLENQYAYEKLTVDAILNQDYDAALKALILNRTVVDTEKAKVILAELMEANRDYWILNKGV